MLAKTVRGRREARRAAICIGTPELPVADYEYGVTDGLLEFGSRSDGRVRVEQTGVLGLRDGISAGTPRRPKGSRCFQTDRGGGFAVIREFFPVEESARDSGMHAGYPRSQGPTDGRLGTPEPLYPALSDVTTAFAAGA
jgi:hypothetical protein